MGIVHAGLAADGTRVAVKSIRAEYATDLAFRARFTREVDLMRRVTGPCLIPLLDADPGASQPWLATEFVPGPTLAAYVATHGPLSGAHLDALAAGTAAALAAVHAAGVVHRDLKPSNVILSPAGPRVLDFGIAHALDETAITRTGAWTGTPGWSSPEQYRGEASGPAADIFAWGALIAFAGTGRHPFGSGRPDEVAFRVMSQDPDLAGLPVSLAPHVEAALSKEPPGRPPAQGLVDHLRPVLAASVTAVVGSHDPTVVDAPVQDAIAEMWTSSYAVDDVPWRTAVRRRGWRRAVSVGAALALAAAATAVGITLTSQNHNAHHGTQAGAPPSPSATARHAPSPTNASSKPLTPTAAGTASASPGTSSSASPGDLTNGCIPISFKTADGPTDCASKNEVCQLGSPDYTPHLEALCGPAPVAHVYVDNTNVASAGGCLALKSTAWVTGTADYVKAGAPAVDCSAFVDRTEIDNSGVPLKSCQEMYPGTRQTFLAVLTTPKGSMTACLTQNVGA